MTRVERVYYIPEAWAAEQVVCIICVKDSFITQDRNVDFVGGQVESTFSQGHCDLTSSTISKK